MNAKLDRQLVVRVPRGLSDALKRDAINHGRTVAQSVRFNLERALRRPVTPARTPRESADACCHSCRMLSGDGPWCGRCGAEMLGAAVEDEGGRFATDLCGPCIVIVRSFVDEDDGTMP